MNSDEAIADLKDWALRGRDVLVWQWRPDAVIEGQQPDAWMTKRVRALLAEHDRWYDVALRQYDRLTLADALAHRVAVRVGIHGPSRERLMYEIEQAANAYREKSSDVSVVNPRNAHELDIKP